MEKNGKAKNIVLAVLLVAVLTLSIAYAILSTTLTINAQATVKAGTWDIHFQRVNNAQSGDICTFTPGSNGSTGAITTPATIDVTQIADLAVNFSAPGDKVTCTWEVTNAGTFNADLATFTKGTPSATGDNAAIANDIIYTIKYDSATGTDVAPHDKLAKASAATGHTKKIVMTIEWEKKSTAQTLPSADVAISGLGATFVYEQD